MNQSGFIAGFLLAAFILFLAANNRLVAYTDVLWGTPATTAEPAKQTGPGVAPTLPATQPNASTQPSSQSSVPNILSDPIGAFENGLSTLSKIGNLFGGIGL